MLETIDYYNKASVFVLLLDASKTFDWVIYCILFTDLLKRDVLPIGMRLLLYIYIRIRHCMRDGIMHCQICLVAKMMQTRWCAIANFVCKFYRWFTKKTGEWCRLSNWLSYSVLQLSIIILIVKRVNYLF